jgi:D-sedoheptulose 7-phosphate isomerase
MEFAKNYLSRLNDGFAKIDLSIFGEIADVLLAAYVSDKQVFILGNGGSAAIASHMACDLSKGTLTNVYDTAEKRFRAISLTDNMPLFSALANDIGYEEVFSQQLRNLIQPGDIVIGISASGNSPNVISALRLARERRARTIGFVGFDGGKMKTLSDYVVHFQEKNYQRCEDAFSVFQHLITSFVREKKKKHDGERKSRVSVKGKKVRSHAVYPVTQ